MLPSWDTNIDDLEYKFGQLSHSYVLRRPYNYQFRPRLAYQGYFIHQMSASLPTGRAPPASRYDLSSYWGRVRHAVDISDPR